MFLDGIALSGYRSFGKEVQKIGPLQKINFLVGQNNSGKSNILLFMKHHLHNIFTNKPAREITFSSLDSHIGSDIPMIQFAIALDLDGTNYQNLISTLPEGLTRLRNWEDLIKTILTSKTLSNGTRTAWFIYEASSLTGAYSFREKYGEELYSENILNPSQWKTIWGHTTNRTGGDIRKHWIPETIKALSLLSLSYLM